MGKTRKLSRSEAGRRGGNQTKKRHGRQHYQEAGRKGFLVTVARHWQGDKPAYIRWLHAHGWIAEVDRAFRESGETCIEIAPIPGLDDEEEDSPAYALRLAILADLIAWHRSPRFLPRRAQEPW
jgi:hypothetical protein